MAQQNNSNYDPNYGKVLKMCNEGYDIIAIVEATKLTKIDVIEIMQRSFAKEQMFLSRRA